jgi:DNA topoisomerase I
LWWEKDEREDYRRGRTGDVPDVGRLLESNTKASTGDALPFLSDNTAWGSLPSRRLRYVSHDQPGYTRKATGDDFEYFDTEGKPIRDEQRLLRIKRLAIPPAYTDVWICPSANGHIQATGRDTRGRKQYRYHERWRAARDENKYDRMALFGEALPKIRKRVETDLALPGLQQNKVLATVVQLLHRTFIRVGNEEYARDNNWFGLTTMKGRHVDVTGSKLRFCFQGKSGIKHDVDIQD